MCDYYVKADPILYESRTRTIRIRGISTSIRLENFAWDVLSKMASSEGITTNALIVQFHDEILKSRGDVQNFTSFLRVTCLRFLSLQCQKLEEQFAISGDTEDTEALEFNNSSLHQHTTSNIPH